MTAILISISRKTSLGKDDDDGEVDIGVGADGEGQDRRKEEGEKRSLVRFWRRASLNKLPRQGKARYCTIP